MQQKYLRDQRGVAMLLELLLVAAVVTLAGLAVYQADHRPKTTASAAAQTAPSSPAGLAASAAAVSEQSSATDAAISADADSSASQINQTATDVTNLGDSSNASF
ncbi:MAG TPA: hypothetical protein VMS08_01890 [Candidatus Saccharimonadia bacterium]|nr:hypothetical protein [Candidatus Saccharimonadia bacterium]